MAKLSWGKRVAILYLGFVALMVVLVAGSMRQSFELVAPDYYAQEIAYQKTIDAAKNGSALSAPVKIEVDEAKLSIILPAEFKDKVSEADVHFYSPVSSKLDKKLKVTTLDAVIVISRKELARANYNIKISWTCDSKHYYQEITKDLRKI